MKLEVPLAVPAARSGLKVGLPGARPNVVAAGPVEAVQKSGAGSRAVGPFTVASTSLSTRISLNLAHADPTGARPGRHRSGRPQLREALTGHFSDHHAFLLAQMLSHVDDLDHRIAIIEGHLDNELAPFSDELARLDEIPGIGRPVAAQILAEIGTDMTRFPTAGRLASWAKLSPTVQESAGKPKGSAATGRGNRYLARALGEAAVGASRTHTFLGERYRRIVRHRGKKIALVAVGRSMLVIIWHLLSNPNARFIDLGPQHYDNRGNTERAIRRHLNALHALGYTVTVNPAA